ncbi:unnamed protein product [Caenorhabditis bovis]|uniref:Spindle assembly abnormal protein 5 implico domain-containing protein n=1 Tax=Caenorhabditis bovis TaxID=2654633 RepID=A0A8S1ECB3_9PELO|nr:unnamed protein product [Caenorhabditis bovis]
MNSYEELPCSVYLPNRIDFSRPTAPDQISEKEVVVEEPPPETTKRVEPQPEKSVPKSTQKKSCLSNTIKKPNIVHPALRKKTVAFGKTVNVSQTIEGTSRAAKKMAAKSPTVASKEEYMANLEKIEQKFEEKHQELLQKFQESAQFQEECKNEIINVVKEQNRDIGDTKRLTSGKISVSEMRRIVKTERRIPVEALAVLEDRLRMNPIFRQTIDDALAEAEDEENRYGRRSPYREEYMPSRPLEPSTTQNALMRETLTVERSIRLDNAMSIDSRQWLNGSRAPEKASSIYRDRSRDRWQAGGNAEILHSTYQPGNSISYYPSASDSRLRRNQDDYYVEHVSDHDDHHDGIDRHAESRAEKERRIREKYARKK